LTKAKEILEKDFKEIVELEQKIYESEIKKP
jgi:ABC-type ATPase with predicted acetyltransferase domain